MRSRRPHSSASSDQQPHGFIGDPVFGVVQINAPGFGGQALAAARIVGEELPQMQITDHGVMGLECLPGRALGQGSARRAPLFQRIALHVSSPFDSQPRAVAARLFG
jgi:hypothetical protein